ncbi:DUF262 domain-containing protein [Shinella sp.]|uniref:DUF262 domain-containing protein n=1 Tax=Shinella sp. TaxID=1870904 RepID=UPI00301DB048
MEHEQELELDQTEAPAEDEGSGPQKYEIMNYPADTTLAGYLEMWDRKQLVVPPFQRAYVWDQVKASKLIESFLLGLPVPGVFLFKERSSSEYLIIDGQQRITSVIFFMRGLFQDKAFRLKSVAKKWDGKTFSELSEEDQFLLKGCVLRSTIIQQISPDDKSSIYPIFERLNTGGVNLNPMEIRQCVSYGPFVKWLREMNTDNNWRAIVGTAAPDRRLRDVELLLRCLAISRKHQQYEKPMKRFLNDFMEDQRGKDDYTAMGTEFHNICSHIIAELGEKPFHLRGRLNFGVMDSVYTALSANGLVPQLKTKMEALTGQPEYISAVTLNTSDNAELSTRIKLALETLV